MELEVSLGRETNAHSKVRPGFQSSTPLFLTLASRLVLGSLSEGLHKNRGGVPSAGAARTHCREGAVSLRNVHAWAPNTVPLTGLECMSDEWNS